MSENKDKTRSRSTGMSFLCGASQMMERSCKVVQPAFVIHCVSGAMPESSGVSTNPGQVAAASF